MQVSISGPRGKDIKRQLLGSVGQGSKSQEAKIGQTCE